MMETEQEKEIGKHTHAPAPSSCYICDFIDNVLPSILAQASQRPPWP